MTWFILHGFLQYPYIYKAALYIDKSRVHELLPGRIWECSRSHYTCTYLLLLILSISQLHYFSLPSFQRRFKMQEKAVQPFLEYFRSSDRMVTVDVSSGAMEPIWDKVHEVFTSMSLVAWRPVESVLIFAMGKGIN